MWRGPMCHGTNCFMGNVGSECGADPNCKQGTVQADSGSILVRCVHVGWVGCAGPPKHVNDR
jgi:hypothetical protein